MAAMKLSIRCIFAEDCLRSHSSETRLLLGDEVIFCPTFSASKAFLVIS